MPFNARLFVLEEYPDVWLPTGFAMLDRAVDWCKQESLYVILDMHCAPGGQTGDNIDDSFGYPFLFESPEAERLMTEIWTRIARRYKDETIIIGYDLMNEPIPHFYDKEKFNPLLEPLFKRLTNAVRAVDTNHVIFLGGAQWNTNFSVFGPPFAPNLAYTFHKYWNETSDASLQPYLEFRERHDVPMWLGESGENTDEWVAACVKLVESHGIGWAFWPYKKMYATSSIVSVARPPHWDEVVAYAARRTADFEANYKIRPPLEHSRAALRGLVENARFRNTRVSPGYVRALGLQP